MSALEFLVALTQLVFIAIFAVTLLCALRHATPADVDIALCFGATTYVILQQRLTAVHRHPPLNRAPA